MAWPVQVQKNTGLSQGLGFPSQVAVNTRVFPIFGFDTSAAHPYNAQSTSWILPE
jgi:hypothetical protein